MNATPKPKPTPPRPKAPAKEDTFVFSNGNKVPAKPSEKPKFVRKPHLTERPFKNNEGLAQLAKQMEQANPRRSQRRNKKEKK